MKRAIIVVIDSVGIGELPDAAEYGDRGANTIGSVLKVRPDLKIPVMNSLGFSKIEGVSGLPISDRVLGAYGRASEQSRGKDTTTGHWEITGIISEQGFQTYPHGFPDRIIKDFEKRTARAVICNQPASGTEIIERLGQEHMETGALIVYTSADSVFQIAAHEDVVPLEQLYEYCRITRELLIGEDSVARVIARPFVGEPGKFERTPNRRDFSLKPPKTTLLDWVEKSGMLVKAVGKIEDIFAGQGITEAIHTVSNTDGIDKTILYMRQDFEGLIFTNLVDFDAKYGHRRNPQGYADALEQFDKDLKRILPEMKEEDLLIVCADHGNDPMYEGTDHTREYIPVLLYGNCVQPGCNLGTLGSFADIGKTVAEYLNIPYDGAGKSMFSLMQMKE